MNDVIAALESCGVDATVIKPTTTDQSFVDSEPQMVEPFVAAPISMGIAAPTPIAEFEGANKPPRSGRGWIAAAAAAGALLIAVIIIVIKTPDGKTIRIEVPDGSTISFVDGSDAAKNLQSGKSTPVQATSDDINRTAAEWVLRLGGVVSINAHTYSSITDLPEVAFEISWIRFNSIEEVNDEKISQLGELTVLHSLELTGTQVGDHGVEHLANLINLKVLFLNNTQVTNGCMVHLRKMAKLENLVLSATQVDDSGLEFVAEMTNLTQLGLNSNRITNRGLDHIKGMKRLTKLGLLGTEIDDKGLALLHDLKNLRRIELTSTRVTAAGVVAFLKAVPNRKKVLWPEFRGGAYDVLNAENIVLHDVDGMTADVADLMSRLPKLRLYLSGNEIDDVDLAEISGIKNLKFLSVTGTRVTAAGIAAFRQSQPDCKLLCDEANRVSRGDARCLEQTFHATCCHLQSFLAVEEVAFASTRDPPTPRFRHQL
ncbi:MAG: hypothetical protein JKX74_00590, partial [Flavobacteriales bacterium]|nr:hypothetical protein [Flavobacteriales bacterium]